MGNSVMRRVFSLMGRPIRDFNVENRAHKVISRDKPVPAPRHNQDQIDKLIEDNPGDYAAQLKKNEALDKFLKDVYVVSRNPDKPTDSASESKRPLPLSRSAVDDYEYGFKEPDVVPKGKVTLRQAMDFILNHQLKPEINSVKNISENHSLPEDTVKNILHYFKVYEVYVPQERKTKAKFAGPSLPRTKVVVKKYQLESGKDKVDSNLDKNNVT